MSQMSEKKYRLSREHQEILEQGVAEGRYIVIADEGTVRYFGLNHLTPELLKKAMTVQQLRAFHARYNNPQIRD